MATRPQYNHTPQDDGAQSNSAIPTVYYNHLSLYGLLFLGLGCSTEAPTRPALVRPRITRDWDERKETIRDLYITHNMSLKDVVRIMTEKHHFSAT
ncbi:n1-acetylpolyamine oxidase [Colletotrichum kahawae]|uniref:N1-acetylpolyamine oxidase n=1 Tax=Colletotrichum kahawae TaxID=34407 RepID=A0AAD9YBT7_COLKA|nr:n1-acetylpolyamine oxidase [Colletotrichum kahawae]